MIRHEKKALASDKQAFLFKYSWKVLEFGFENLLVTLIEPYFVSVQMIKIFFQIEFKLSLLLNL